MKTLYHISIIMMTLKRKQYVMVCWKDIYIVYFLTNFTSNNEIGSCFYRIQGGDYSDI